MDGHAVESVLRESNQKSEGNRDSSGFKKSPTVSITSETKVTVELRHHILQFDKNVAPEKSFISFHGAAVQRLSFFLQGDLSSSLQAKQLIG